jgi:hypothetical protein
MVQLFADRARVDGTRRAWSRALRDLTISAPNEYWEAFMRVSMQSKLVIAAVVTAIAALGVLAVGGSMLWLALLLLLAWELYAILRTRGHRLSTQRWWKFTGSGVALFAVLFVVFALPWPEEWRSSVDGELAWGIGMFGFSAAIVLVVTGLLMAAARWSSRRGDGAAV